jgi:DNA-binding protein HU-beta
VQNSTKITKNIIIMNKAEVITAIAEEANITKAIAKKALDAFLKTTTHALKSGNKVTLSGFGTFTVTTRAARTGRNPGTGQEIKIPAKRVPQFKPGAELKKEIL